MGSEQRVAGFERVERIVLDVIAGNVPYERGLREVVSYQYRTNEDLRRYWKGQGFDASGDFGWLDVPPVPTEVFRDLTLISSEREASMVFRSSGTTAGARSEHWRYATRAYDVGARQHFADQLGKHGVMTPFERAVHFVQERSEVPDSSLSHMVGDLSDGFVEGPVDYALSEAGFARASTEAALKAAATAKTCVFGTAFGLAEWMERARNGTRLGAGSVVVETGGFKRRRDDSIEDYRRSLREFFGPDCLYLSEYSMTELSSQGYADLPVGTDASIFEFPAWCRVVACDPQTLAPVPSGEVGVLRFVDLANVETVVSVQSADLGVVEGTFVSLQGRSEGSYPRGCSLAAAELLAKQS